MLKDCCKDLAHSYVTPNCDNYAVVELINKLSSKDLLILSVRSLVFVALKYNVNLHAVHILGKLNITRFIVAISGFSRDLGSLWEIPDPHSYTLAPQTRGL